MNIFRQGLREAGLILLLACVLGFSYTATMKKGLFAESPKKPTTTQPSVSNGPQMIHLEEAKSLFESGTSLFIDARHEFDYKLGHIKGAMNIPLKEFDTRKDTLNTYPKDNSIVVYCDGVECNSSIEFAAKLFADGFTNVKIFFGGWKEWTANQLPTEKTAP